MSTSAEKRYMGKVGKMDCITCGAFGVHVHHIRTDRIKNNYLVIPLCPACHMGDFSIHKSKRAFEGLYGSELELLAETISRMNA